MDWPLVYLLFYQEHSRVSQAGEGINAEGI